MHIEPLEVDPPAADVAGVHRVLAAADAVDRPGDPPPVLADVEGRLRTRRQDRRLIRRVARDDGGAIVGYGLLRLPDVDNVHLGLLDVTVHPSARRRGIGTALVRAAVDVAAADGRRLVLAEADEGSGGEQLCRLLGLRLVQTDRMSLLRLADVDWADVTAAAAAAHPGYRLERWVDRCPDALLPAYAAAKSAMNDAPTDDADIVGSTYTPEAIRDDEAAIALQFAQLRVEVALHGATGEVAGLTEVFVATDPRRSHQGDTAVVAAHRGSGLGLWLKADMLVRLRDERPEVAEVLTGNSATNAHMLAINDRLGFRPWKTVLSFQGDTADVQRRLAPAGAR